MLAGNLVQPEQAQVIARKLIATVSRPFVIDGGEVRVTASAGISLCPHDHSDADGLLRHADSAMYRAKERGKNRFAVYREDRGPVTSF